LQLPSKGTDSRRLPVPYDLTPVFSNTTLRWLFLKEQALTSFQKKRGMRPGFQLSPFQNNH
jgi:hypothetical protein